MGRPKKENGKTRQFRLRMTEESFQLLDIVAKKYKCTKTQVMMSAFFDFVSRFSDEEIDGFFEELRERVGPECAESQQKQVS